MSDCKYIKLRAHHGMCLSFYQGKGYSQEFVDNMNDISSKLEQNPTIEITSSCDQLCCYCPNENSEHLCQTESLVASWDQMVIDTCNFSMDEHILYSDFHSIISNKILTTDIFDSICKECQWSNICHHQ